jgi:hypothetical protein
MLAYHRSLWLRSVATGLLLGVVALGVMAATDEGGSTPAMRIARLCAFTPALAALGAAATLELARSRGELRALEALGVSPWGAAFGATLGGWFLGGLAVVGLMLPWSDVAALFPTVTSHDTWVGNAGRAAQLLDRAHGVAVGVSGAVHWVEALPLAEGVEPSPGRGAAIACFAPLAFVTPTWIAAPLPIARRGVEVALTFAIAVLVLHAVAAGRAVVWALPLAALPFAASAVLTHRFPGWKLGALFAAVRSAAS